MRDLLQRCRGHVCVVGLVLAATFYVQPRTMSYFGLNLMLQYAVPIALATIAQMFIITVNDLDLSIGPFVGLVSCIGATLLLDNPLLGTAALLLLIAAGYMTEEENRPLSPTRMSLQQMSNKQILDEICRRTVGDTGGPPIPVRVNGVLHTPDGWTSTP